MNHHEASHQTWISLTFRSDQEFLTPEFVKSQMPSSGKRTSTHMETTAEHLIRIRSSVVPLHSATSIVTPKMAAFRDAQEEINGAVARTLETSSTAKISQRGRPAVSRDRIISRVLPPVEASAGAPLSMHDLCHASGGAARTLRNVFNDYFGIGPMRLLRVRQLREMCEALLATDPTCETVRSVAGRCGIWDFSLFACNYRSLFGEQPSHTLRSKTKRSQRHLSTGDAWLRYAARAFSTWARGDPASQPASSNSACVKT